MAEAITVVANGRPHQTAPGALLTEFIKQVGHHPDRVVVECNGQALPPSKVSSVRLQDGDQLEIVRIVAGG